MYKIYDNTRLYLFSCPFIRLEERARDLFRIREKTHQKLQVEDEVYESCEIYVGLELFIH